MGAQDLMSGTDAFASEVIARYANRVTRMPIQAIVTELKDNLGPTIVAYIGHVRTRSEPQRWAQGESVPRAGTRQRLMAACRVWLMVADHEGSDVARAWFMGMNPWLDDVAPATALRDGQLAEVIDAALALITDQGGA